ncbi:hypothetical protein E4U53_004730, partial [Claviceps sorghi]
PDDRPDTWSPCRPTPDWTRRTGDPVPVRPGQARPDRQPVYKQMGEIGAAVGSRLQGCASNGFARWNTAIGRGARRAADSTSLAGGRLDVFDLLGPELDTGALGRAV